MVKKRVLKITPVLITLNILIIIIICSFYLFRLVKYYRLENVSKPGEKIVLVDQLIKKQSYLDLTKGLVYDENKNTYTYIGSVDDNYVSYSGMLFRIISIDKNKNIKMISEDVVTMMYSGLEKGYNDSFVNSWLNSSEEKYSGVFENNLYDKEKYLVKSDVCIDSIDDLSNITCDEVNSEYNVTLLSLSDYKNAGGKNSYLNNGTSFYLSSLNSNNENYYLLESGEISLNQSNSKITGVRAVITIKGDNVLLSGNGSYDEPYVFEKHEVSKLADAYVGNYVNIGEDLYKIVDVKNDKVKVALAGVLKENEEDFSIEFSKTTNKYGIDTIVGKYLNEDYYKLISDKVNIIKSDYPVGEIVLSDLDYRKVFDEVSNVNIGMLTFGDMYVNDCKNVFTLSRGLEDENIINVLNEDGNVYADYNYNKYNVRPAMYLDGNTEIISGIGSEHGPYQLGVSNE